MENVSTTEDGVQGEAAEEALETVGPAGGEVGSEAVPADVLHALFVWEGRHSRRGIVFTERFVQEDEVGEAAADGGSLFVKGREGGLNGQLMGVPWEQTRRGL